ncbi:MAG TPA: tetratricopeptide repeat protein [Candidatus Hydrogenedentes bacterium]|nr:tetratricopeptide repeat protein [Candidatus Hydrogenedentota bacterium]HOH33405.1 tetratricopeptide repeat protein [Candidatus Hydrogenedentota bacterium]HQE75925.1 tetratricopeptide repeat protein [Candidatus Hydrogenedentota bacterium]
MASSMMNCPYCGKLTDPRLDNCVHCGGFLRKKAAPGQRRSSGEKETCPTCGALVQAGDIICVACGTNLLTGQRITEEQPAPAKAKKRSFTMPSVSLKWIGIATLGFLVVVILLFLLALFLRRDRIGAAIEEYNKGNAAQAVSALNDYIQSVPDSVEARQALAWMYWENREYAYAAEQLASVVRLAPANREAHRGLALSWAKAGGEEGRRRAQAALETMVQQFPADSEAWYLLGLLRGVEGNAEGQVAALREAAVGAGAPGLAARRLTAVGIAAQGHTESAHQAIQKVLEEAPSDGDVLATAGLLASEENDWIGATEYLKSAVDSGTALEGDALTQLAILLISRREFEEARGYLERALALDENNLRARLFLAVCQREQGLHEAALQQLEPLLKTSGPLAAEAAVEAARVHLAMDDPARATQSLQQAIQLGGSDAALYTLQGRAYARSGEAVAARDAFRKALQTDSAYAPAHLEFGLFYLERGEPTEAVRMLERYLELIDPATEDAHAEEVRTLVAQLKESLDATGGAA